MAGSCIKDSDSMLLSIIDYYAYYRNYYMLLLIPVGALLCLVIKKLSDFSALNRGIGIKINDDLGKIEVLGINGGIFNSVLEHTQQLNNAMFVVDGMAVKLGEFAKVIENESGRVLKGFDVYGGFKHVIDMFGNSVVTMHRDFICFSDAPYREVSARVIYEKVMDDGSLKTKKKTGIKEFLKRSGVICYNDLDLELLRRYLKISTKVSVLNSFELRALRSAEGLYHKGNALLLFLELGKLVEVVEC